MKKEVIIVVPLYTSKLTLFDKISLEQLHRVLGKYPIAYVMPEKMRNVNLDVHGGETVYFSDKYFVSVQSYSRLCLEPFFYEQFHDYEYMLIYQTDAFVFRNDLKKFCDMGYDYIGAPWPYLGVNKLPIRPKYRVGNGGLSLRRIESALKVLKHKQQILRDCSFSKYLLDAEDFFWTYCATLGIENFHLANEIIALSFSSEGFQNKWMCKRTMKTLPFGCHSWNHVTQYPTFKKWIEKYGYTLPALSERQKGTLHIRYHRLHILHDYLNLRLKREQLCINFLFRARMTWSLRKMIYFSLLMRGVKLHIIKFE